MWAKIKAWVIAIWKKYWKWILGGAAILILGFWLGWKIAAAFAGGGALLGFSNVESAKKNVQDVGARQEDRKARANRIKDEVNK